MKNITNSKPYTKEEVDEIMTEIDEKLSDYIKSNRYKDVLMMMGNLGRYSLTNQIYILLQNPNASYVSGMKGWNYMGRSVKSGEKALKIFAPITEKAEREVVDENGKAILDQDGNPVKHTYNAIKGFKPSYVFDVSQTEGKEIKPLRFNDSTVEEKELIMKGLIKTVSDNGFTVEYADSETLGDGCYGLCNHTEKKILLLKGMSDTQTVSTLAHECGHALAHNPYKRKFEGLTVQEKREIKEVEAESIACVVCSYLGLDTEEFNFAYITGWADGDLSKFRKNMDVISENANKLINGIEDAFIENKKEKYKESSKKKEEMTIPFEVRQPSVAEAC